MKRLRTTSTVAAWVFAAVALVECYRGHALSALAYVVTVGALAMRVQRPRAVAPSASAPEPDPDPHPGFVICDACGFRWGSPQGFECTDHGHVAAAAERLAARWA